MYRDSGWMKGYYIDNHMKYQCLDCSKEFILGKELCRELKPGYPVCPYCGSPCIDLTVWTEDDMLPGLSSDMGCLAITYEESGVETG